ncbi:hypothetical protein CANARDRAFT_26837 [[Candida] arabinofermentans NRRL YB-2248]|uniref:Cyclin N-terminal domain-containing protein n=1 Tax=[Candida] arabinofermentans NRRL YB-2248 TaxID=983967 RepID=A0A1E4T6P7_9ASCO|nr:hypothetical protein CANARDRAFT_26837 [[Candida] arabinofermentans NRRL YB-2248]
MRIGCTHQRQLLTPSQSKESPLNASNKQHENDIITIQHDATPQNHGQQQQQHQQQQQQKLSISTSLPITTQFDEQIVRLASLLLSLIFPITNTATASGLASLDIFVKEVLKRSKTSIPVFKVTIYYLLILYKSLMKSYSDISRTKFDSLNCPRRCFLTCLILASKYLQDNNYTFKIWKKITGLSVQELNSNEFKVLKLLDFDLHLTEQTSSKFTKLMDNSLDIISSDRFELPTSTLSLLSPSSSSSFSSFAPTSPTTCVYLNDTLTPPSSPKIESQKHSKFPATSCIDTIDHESNSCSSKLARLFIGFFESIDSGNIGMVNDHATEKSASFLDTQGKNKRTFVDDENDDGKPHAGEGLKKLKT